MAFGAGGGVATRDATPDEVKMGSDEVEALTAKLSPGQEKALKEIAHWYFEKPDVQVFRMFGQAGTGKTTIAVLVPHILGLDNYHFAAFSGKAAEVLRRKGCVPSATIHSLLYGAPRNLSAELTRALNNLDTFEKIIAASEAEGKGRPEFHVRAALDTQVRIDDLRSLIRKVGSLYWGPREDSILPMLDLLIVDEVSMVSDRMANDLLESGIRILVLGDQEQLPPVRGEGYFTREKPDVILTEVHRQALDSPVIQLATRVRNGYKLRQEDYTPGKYLDYTKFDQILCWTKKTRWGAVKHVRDRLNRPSGTPVPGDSVMNLQNNKDLGIFNGQSGFVLDVAAGRNEDELTLTVELDGESRDFFVFKDGFTMSGEAALLKARVGWNGEVALFTFAHALTVHKAQGSEWGDVCLIDETSGMWKMTSEREGGAKADEMVRRFLYTGITRASQKITMVRK